MKTTVPTKQEMIDDLVYVFGQEETFHRDMLLERGMRFGTIHWTLNYINIATEYIHQKYEAINQLESKLEVPEKDQYKLPELPTKKEEWFVKESKDQKEQYQKYECQWLKLFRLSYEDPDQLNPRDLEKKIKNLRTETKKVSKEISFLNPIVHEVTWCETCLDSLGEEANNRLKDLQSREEPERKRQKTQ